MKNVVKMKSTNQTKAKEIIKLGIDEINEDDNIRAEYRENDLGELMSSMRQYDQLQPIGVRPNKDKWTIVWGHRRYHAAKKLGWETIEAVEANDTNDERDYIVMQTVENIQRADISMPEQGRIYAKLQTMGLTLHEIAARVGINHKRVQNALDAYNKIPAHIQKRIKAPSSHVGSAKAPKGVIRPSAAMQVLGLVRAMRLSKDDANTLYDYAASGDASYAKVKTVGSLVQQGATIQSAIKEADAIRIIQCAVPVPVKNVKAIEKEYGITIHEFIYSFLSTNQDLGIARSKPKTKVIVRKSAANKRGGQ